MKAHHLDFLIDLIGLAAIALISYGTWLIYEPAAFIVAGVILLVGVILISRRRAWASSAQHSQPRQ